MYKAGDWLDNVVAEALPQNEKYKDDFWATKVPRGFGSMLGFVGAGGAGKAMRMPNGGNTLEQG